MAECEAGRSKAHAWLPGEQIRGLALGINAARDLARKKVPMSHIKACIPGDCLELIQ